MKSYAGFKFLKLPPASLLHLSPQLPSVFWSEAPWRVSAASPSLGRAQLSSSPCHHSVVAGVCLAKPREHLASLRKPLLPGDTKHATYLHCCLVGPIFPMSPRGNRNQASPSTPHPTLFCPHNPALENIWRPQKWEYPLMFILAGSFSFLLLFLIIRVVENVEN